MGASTTLYVIDEAPAISPAYAASWNSPASNAVRMRLRSGNNSGVSTKTVSVPGHGHSINSNELFIQAVSDVIPMGDYICIHGLTRMSGNPPGAPTTSTSPLASSIINYRFVNATSGANVTATLAETLAGAKSGYARPIDPSRPTWTSGVFPSPPVWLYFIDSAWRAHATQAGSEASWASGIYTRSTFAVDVRLVAEFGVNLFSYTGSLDFSMEYGQADSSGILSLADQTVAGNGFVQLTSWSGLGDDIARYTRPFAATHRPDRIQYPTLEPIGVHVNDVMLNAHPVDQKYVLNELAINSRSLNS